MSVGDARPFPCMHTLSFPWPAWGCRDSERKVRVSREMGGGRALDGDYVLVVFFHREFQTRAQTGNFPECSHQHQRLSHQIGKIWDCAYGTDMKPVLLPKG